MAFPVFGFRLLSKNEYDASVDKLTSVAAECGGCKKPVAALLRFHQKNSYDHHYKSTLPHVVQPQAVLSDLCLSLEEVWPKPRDLSIPASLPEPVERSYIQAEKNYLMPDCEEAAATMYRRSLDIALKDKYPEHSGMLDKKLKALVVDKSLPPQIGEWAHEVRIIGNDGAHDIEGVSRADLDAARAFIDTVLRYLFTLPAQIASRRAPAPAESPATDAPSP